MTAVSPIPEGCEGVIPHLVVQGAAKAMDFYKAAFGAEEVMRMPGPDGRILHGEMRIGGSLVFLADDFPEMCGGQEKNPKALGATPCSFHLYVTDADASIARAEKAGATVKMPAADMFWGDRYGVIEDPFGHQWAFATHKQDMTPEEMKAAQKKALAEMGREGPK